MLHASAGLRKTAAPAPPPAPPPTTARTTSGKRVILSLGGLFVAMCVAATGLAFCDRSAQRNTGTAVLTAEASAVVRDPRASAAGRVAPIPTAPAPAPAPSPACTQFRLDGAPARPDAATGKRVGAAWLRIEKWLAAKAPASSRSLKPPARAADIDLAQRRMSVRFPADLVASLLRHNGAAGGGFTLPFMHRPMTVAEIPAQWWMLCGIVTDSPGLRGYWWDSGFVPFADAGDGGSLVADQRPGNHGRVGEFFDENGVSFETWPASVAELLERTATSLETGKPFAGRFRPVVTGGRLAWDVV